MSVETLLELLRGKVIMNAELKNECLTVTFTDNSTLKAAARCGSGAGGNWYTWTEVAVNGQKIIDK